MDLKFLNDQMNSSVASVIELNENNSMLKRYDRKTFPEDCSDCSSLILVVLIITQIILITRVSKFLIGQVVFDLLILLWIREK